MIVAQVGGVGTISKAALDHWTRVEIILVHELAPRHPAPRGLIPDPPRYAACIAYLRHVLQQAGETAKTLTLGALKSNCRHREQYLRANTLNKLISWDWTIGRGLALGMRVTDAQARRRISDVVQGSNLYGPHFAKYLRLTGQTMADILFRSRVQLYETKISERAAELMDTLPKGLTESQRQKALAMLANHFLATDSWVAKTSCRSGFIVSACRQYRGPEQAPGAVN